MVAVAPYKPSQAAQMAFHTTSAKDYLPDSVSLGKRCHLSSGGGDWLCKGDLICTFPASFESRINGVRFYSRAAAPRRRDWSHFSDSSS